MDFYPRTSCVCTLRYDSRPEPPGNAITPPTILLMIPALVEVAPSNHRSWISFIDQVYTPCQGVCTLYCQVELLYSALTITLIDLNTESF